MSVTGDRPAHKRRVSVHSTGTGDVEIRHCRINASAATEEQSLTPHNPSMDYSIAIMTRGRARAQSDASWSRKRYTQDSDDDESIDEVMHRAKRKRLLIEGCAASKSTRLPIIPRLDAAGRLAVLRADSRASQIDEYCVWCRTCIRMVKLGNTRYCLKPWFTHCARAHQRDAETIRSVIAAGLASTNSQRETEHEVGVVAGGTAPSSAVPNHHTSTIPHRSVSNDLTPTLAVILQEQMQQPVEPTESLLTLGTSSPDSLARKEEPQCRNRHIAEHAPANALQLCSADATKPQDLTKSTPATLFEAWRAQEEQDGDDDSASDSAMSLVCDEGTSLSTRITGEGADGLCPSVSLSLQGIAAKFAATSLQENVSF